ncbi:hypothetical protein Mapa_008470 [Marchantia paleacea]|nr:hypothetical protein Mapa_008470 [Marchantia paleacea]
MSSTEYERRSLENDIFLVLDLVLKAGDSICTVLDNNSSLLAGPKVVRIRLHASIKLFFFLLGHMSAWSTQGYDLL